MRIFLYPIEEARRMTDTSVASRTNHRRRRLSRTLHRKRSHTKPNLPNTTYPWYGKRWNTLLDEFQWKATCSFHRFTNHNIRSAGTWSEQSLQLLHNTVDRGQGCLLFREPETQDHYSRTYLNVPWQQDYWKIAVWLEIYRTSGSIASLWVQWFKDPKVQYQLMNFSREIYERDNYRFNTQHSTLDQESPNMQVYMTGY